MLGTRKQLSDFSNGGPIQQTVFTKIIFEQF
jgi:hypothetical protein